MYQGLGKAVCIAGNTGTKTKVEDREWEGGGGQRTFGEKEA